MIKNVIFILSIGLIVKISNAIKYNTIGVLNDG